MAAARVLHKLVNWLIPGSIMQQRCAVTSICLTEQSVEMCEHANLHLRHLVHLPHHHSLENSTTFQDLALKFPGLPRTKPIFQDFPGPGNCTPKNPGLSRSMGTLFIFQPDRPYRTAPVTLLVKQGSFPISGGQTHLSAPSQHSRCISRCCPAWQLVCMYYPM